MIKDDEYRSNGIIERWVGTDVVDNFTEVSMKKLLITEKDFNNILLPSVILDKDKEVFKLFGIIFAEHDSISTHFEIIYNWIDNYSKDPNKHTDFYLCFNDSSTYAIHSWIIPTIKKINEIPGVEIYWLYEQNDYDTEELIDDLILMTETNLRHKKVSKKELVLFKEPYYIPS